MNKPRHTQTPWQFVQGGSGDYPTWNVRIGDSVVTLPGVFDMQEMDANAFLIAAAPDLLAALVDCLKYLENDIGGPDDSRPEREQARAAIARATGAR